jgi:hypothetical protein
MLRAGCLSATGGYEKLGLIESEWTIVPSDSSHLNVMESVTYPARLGPRTDVYRGELPCPP